MTEKDMQSQFVYYVMYSVCQGYNYWRKWCGFNKADTFDDLVDHPQQVADRYRRIYRSVVWGIHKYVTRRGGGKFTILWRCVT